MSDEGDYVLSKAWRRAVRIIQIILIGSVFAIVYFGRGDPDMFDRVSESEQLKDSE